MTFCVTSVNINKEELTANLKNNKNLAESNLYKHFVKDTIETPSGKTWAVICGNYSFGVNIDDIAALIRISQFSQLSNAPFIFHTARNVRSFFFGFCAEFFRFESPKIPTKENFGQRFIPFPKPDFSVLLCLDFKQAFPTAEIPIR